MATVVRRTFRSTPSRDALATWIAIVDMLTQDSGGEARAELIAVEGIAACVIADHAPSDTPIVVTCDGPRTRIYCLYDEDAIDGSDANENLLGFDPLKGGWRVSLPCQAEDLSWVQNALSELSSRITARELGAAVPDDESLKANKEQSLVLDTKRFLGS